MLRIILSFTAGFVIAKLFPKNYNIDKIKEIAKENTEKVKNTSKKVVQVVKEEFGKKEVEEPQ